MNWKEEAVEDLRCYTHRRESLYNLNERCQALQEQLESLRGACTDRTPVQGGASKYEDWLVKNMDEQRRLQLNFRATRRLVQITRRGLDALNERERLVLECLYIDRNPNSLDTLMDTLQIEKSRVYRIKDEAIKKFTLSVCGITEL